MFQYCILNRSAMRYQVLCYSVVFSIHMPSPCAVKCYIVYVSDEFLSMEQTVFCLKSNLRLSSCFCRQSQSQTHCIHGKMMSIQQRHFICIPVCERCMENSLDTPVIVCRRGFIRYFISEYSIRYCLVKIVYLIFIILY